MRATDITVFYSTLRLEAMERILAEQGTDLNTALTVLLDGLYQKTVPVQERERIESAISQELIQEYVEKEAARRFGVYRIREQGEDSYFFSELHNNFYLASCECRQYLQGDGQTLLADHFKHKESFGVSAYRSLVRDLGYDPRITMVVELDVDAGLCMMKTAAQEDTWHCYKIKDMSTAVFQAKRKEGLSLEKRMERFSDCLRDREIASAVPVYSVQEQQGRPVRERVKAFNQSNKPFRIRAFDGGRYSLSLPLSFLDPPYTNYGQNAFDAYAALCQSDPKCDGVFTMGSGYDWERVFQAAFQNEPLLDAIRFDSEAGMFCCYTEDLYALEELGSRFKTMCDDEIPFREFVCDALWKADLHERMAYKDMAL